MSTSIIKLYEFYVSTFSDELVLLGNVSVRGGVIDESIDDELITLSNSVGISGWNYVACGHSGLYRDRLSGDFLVKEVINAFFRDDVNSFLMLQVLEGEEVGVKTVPRIRGYDYYSVSPEEDGKIADLVEVLESVIKEKPMKILTTGLPELEEISKYSKSKLLDLCMKHIDVRLWNENMVKKDLVSIFKNIL